MKQWFEKRVALIAEAVTKASLMDSSLGIARTEERDALDPLIDVIEDLLRRFHDSARTFQSAHDALLKPLAAEERIHTRIEALMKALEEDIPDTIYFKDLQGRFIHISKAHLRAFNLMDKSEVIGKTDFDFFTEEHAKQAFEDEQRIIRTGQPIINKEEKETWLGHPSTWALTTKMPLRDPSGAIVGTFGISRDITERKRAEEALRKSEERYRLLFNSINDAVFVHELASDGMPGRFIEVNGIACELLGYSREELLRMGPYDLLAPQAVSKAQEMTVRLQAENHALWEGAYLSKAGLRIPVEVSNHLFDLEGKPAILSTVRDITRRKQLEENLEREKALLLTLINNLPDYISIKDTEGRVLITNTANARIMGLEATRDAVGKSDLDFYPSSEADRYLSDERAIIRTGTALINKEEESFDRQGHVRWTLTTKVPLRDPQGKVIGVVCTGRDITERKQSEQSFQDLARLPDENPNPVMRVSLDGTVLYANQSSRSLLPSWAGAQGDKVPSDSMAELLRAWESGERREVEAREGKDIFLAAIATSRRASRGGGKHPREACGGRCRAQDVPSPRSGKHQGRPGADRAGAHKPRRQLSGCHAGRRETDHRNLKPDAGNRVRPGAPRCEAGRVCTDLGQR